MFRKLLTSVAIALVALTSTACVPSSVAAPSTTESFYAQKLVTKKCGEFLCGTVSAPIDWNKPGAGSFKLAFTYKPVSNTKKFLFVNPGGPGASGVSFVRDNLSSIGTATLRSNFNIVGFDPRGTGSSSPIKCLNNKDMDSFLYDDTGYATGTKEDLAASRASIAKFVAACKKNTGPILGHVDTVSAAKDLDLLRAVFGQQKLDYVGFSYGTFLGTTYAALFPTKVGRFVLDGAIDPSVSDEEMNYNQLVGFDQALKNYMKDCIANVPTCPFSGTVDQGLARISSFMKTVELNPITGQDGRSVGLSVVDTGLSMSLYSQEYWQYLTQAFNDAFDSQDGTMFLALADAYNERNQGGGYASNMLEAFISINCLDARSNPSEAAQKAQNAKMLKASPTLGPYWQWGAELCAHWPYPVAKRPASYAAKGSPSILVIGTTGDPATPYKEAVALAHKVLSKGFLVTYTGEGHTAYGRSNTCVDNTVDNFLTKGTLPKTEPKC